MAKKFFIIICLVVAFLTGIVFFVLQNKQNVVAGTSHNVYGWAWSENIGWLSFNCVNCQGNAKCDKTAACTGLGYDYGVNIANDGKLSGYAWSRGADTEGGVGWISFNETDLSGCPQAPCRAWMEISGPNIGKVYGWAKAVSGYSGWPGWIRLRGQAQDGSAYGVYLELLTKEFWGYAWGETALGWISFNLKNCDSDGDGITDTINNPFCTPGQVLPPMPPTPPLPPGPPFPPIPPKVITTFSFPPAVDNLQTSSQNLCSLPSQLFQWLFVDVDSVEQKAYRLQVDFNGNWGSVVAGEFDSDYTEASTNSKLVEISMSSEIGKLKYNTNYNWRVMVWDQDDQTSAWVNGPSFTTPLHRAPQVAFSFSPLKPTKDERVIFNDLAVCYNASNNSYSCALGGADIEYAWDFSYQDPPGFTTDYSIKGGNASTTYSALGTYIVKFRITDNTLLSPNNVCIAEQAIIARPKLPIWQEVQP